MLGGISIWTLIARHLEEENLWPVPEFTATRGKWGMEAAEREVDCGAMSATWHGNSRGRT